MLPDEIGMSIPKAGLIITPKSAFLAYSENGMRKVYPPPKDKYGDIPSLVKFNLRFRKSGRYAPLSRYSLLYKLELSYSYPPSSKRRSQ
jgi:hypothetical protein